MQFFSLDLHGSRLQTGVAPGNLAAGRGDRSFVVSSGLDLLGWGGGGLGAVAYVLVSSRRIVADGPLFQGLNMVGAALLCVASFHSGALPSACMNIAWILFGVQSLATASQRRRRATSAPAPSWGGGVALGPGRAPMDAPEETSWGSDSR